MAELTGKRRGRPRKNLDVPNAAAEGEDASNADDGIRETGGDRHTLPEDDGAEGPGMDWNRFVDVIRAKTYGKGRENVRICFHPAPESEIIAGDWNVIVRQGQVGYLTSDGKMNTVV